MSEVAKVLSNLKEQLLDQYILTNDLLWKMRMGLFDDPEEGNARLVQAYISLQQFGEDPPWLQILRDLEAQTSVPAEKGIILSWERMFQSTLIEDAEARTFSKKLLTMQGELEARIAKFDWGYKDPVTGEFVREVSNRLSNLVSTAPDEGTRKAAYEGLIEYEKFLLANGFADIVKARNKMAHMLGYGDFYEMQTQRNEGLSKEQIFHLIDDFELNTREAARISVENIVRIHGESAREPWNFGRFRRGNIAKERDPYMPFERSLERWVRSFAALGITFRGAELTLDLVDRRGKYPNGFMHAPVPSFYDGSSWNPARVNFCSHALPDKEGAGDRALEVLFHEGGHAAHWSNVTQPSPSFSLNPFPISYPETQSMFLDRILKDADWMTRYAKSPIGEPIPFELIQRGIELDQPFEAFSIRRIPMICYFEKALYEMPEEEMTSENILELARSTERRLLLLNGNPMPILASTHPVDMPAYNHGYVLADMAVFQTREYFESKYGYIVDNPEVGAELAEAYWSHGNSKSFFSMVGDLTGKPFSADALVREVTRSVDETIEKAKSEVDQLKSIPEFSGAPELDAHIRVMHGNETICEFKNASQFESANEQFTNWVTSHYPRKK